jgi:hypothetical protein
MHNRGMEIGVWILDRLFPGRPGGHVIPQQTGERYQMLHFTELQSSLIIISDELNFAF